MVILNFEITVVKNRMVEDLKMLALLLIATLLSSLANAQELSTVKYETEVCDCLEADDREFDAARIDAIFMDCMMKPFERSEEELMEYFQIDKNDLPDNVNPFESGKQMGQKIISDIQPKLIKNCDTYYQFMSATQDLMLNNLKTSFTKSYHDSISKVLAADPSRIDLNFERGCYFLSHEAYDLALQEFEVCRNSYLFRPAGLFFSGWSYDLKKERSTALDYYLEFLAAMEPIIKNSESVINAETQGMVDAAKIKIALIERAKN